MDREARIRARAYDIWEAEGAPHGRHDEHWSRASGEIEQEDDAGAAPSVADAETADDVAPAKPKRAAKAITAKPAAKSPAAKEKSPAAKPTTRAPRGKGKPPA